MHALDPHVIQLPRGLDIPTLSQSLYPEAYDRQANQRSLLSMMSKLRREHSSLVNTASPGVSPENVARQILAVEAAQRVIYDRVCELYFAEPGWTQFYLDKPDAQQLTWYFFASFEQGQYDSTAYYVSWFSGVVLRGYGRHYALSVKDSSHSVYLHSHLGLPLERAEFRGPAYGLVDWARANEIFLKVVTPSVSH